MIIKIETGTYKGVWRILSINNNVAGLKLDLGQPDTVRPRYDAIDPETGKKKSKTTPGCKLMASLETAIKGGLNILNDNLIGTAAPKPKSK